MIWAINISCQETRLDRKRLSSYNLRSSSFSRKKDSELKTSFVGKISSQLAIVDKDADSKTWFLNYSCLKTFHL